MTKDCYILNPLQRDGTSQKQRLTKALDPSYVLVDERDLADLLLYARKFATLIRYYNRQNTSDGNWLAFIESDISTLVAVIKTYDVEEKRNQVFNLLKEFEQADIAGKSALLEQLFPEFVAIALVPDTWHKQSVAGLALHSELSRQISSIMNDAMRSAIAYEKSFTLWAGISPLIDVSSLSTAWQLENIQPDLTFFNEGLAASDVDFESLAQRLRLLFQTLFDNIAAVIRKASAFLEETLNNYPEHQPYMALFLAFLKVFEYAQRHINTLTLKHLNFYYNEVLGLEAKPAQPDEVHVVFELAKTFFSHKLEKGALFKAGKDNNKEDVFFAADNELVINRTTIAEEGIKSIFLDKEYYPGISGESYLIKNIYASPIANSADGRGAVIEDEEGKWKAFGDATRPFATVGFAIASPLLYLREGSRTVTVRFAVGKNADLQIGQGSSDSHKVAYELKHNIKVYYTGEKEWVECTINKVDIDIVSGNTEGSLVFDLKIPSGDPAAVAYNEKVHLAGLNTQYPVFKFILDNEGLSADAFLPDCSALMSLAEIDQVDKVVAARILHFLNNAKVPEEIAGAEPQEGPVFDNPDTGYGDQIKDYDIGIGVATKLINQRPASGYTSLHQIAAIKGLGIDKINDLIYSFCFGDYDLSTVKEETSEYDAQKNYNAGEFAYYENELYQANIASKGFQPNANPAQWSHIERAYPYQYLKDIHILSLLLDVHVEGMKDLVLESDIGVLNPSKPFQPFGPQPKVGSKFFIGSAEVFQKRVSEINLHIDWANLPGESFNTYYTYYNSNGTSPVANNEIFTIQYEWLYQGKWYKKGDAGSPLKTDGEKLFSPANGTPQSSRTMSVTIDSELLGRNTKIAPFANLAPQLERGFMMMNLKQDFFHRVYPRALAGAAIANDATKIPNEPYTPVIGSLSLEYRASEEVSYSELEKRHFEDRIERLFHIGPYGIAEIFPVAGHPDKDVPVNRNLVPQFLINEPDKNGLTFTTTDAEGTLYIGLKDLMPPQSLSVLFQVSEGSADPDRPKQEIIWSYMAHNRWVDFEPTEIVSEATNDLLKSGIITFSLPRAITKNNTALPGDTYWIKASVAREKDAVCQLIAILPQAIKTTAQISQKNDLNRLLSPLPAETISKLKFRQAALKKVEQPFASFNGKWVEKLIDDITDIQDLQFTRENNAFYVRVSERLRHKGRGITIWDYERLVLEAFPDVYKVKCLNHTSLVSEHAPGFVKVIVIPNLRNKNAIDPLQPRISLNKLDEIHKFLGKRISDFITLHVKNPLYEKVQVSFKVALHPGKDSGYYLMQMQEDIRKFLTPWLHDEGEDLILGGRIHRSSILNFLEETDYVDYLTDFKMFHQKEEDGPWEEVEEAIASTSGSTLVSAANHSINLLEETNA